MRVIDILSVLNEDTGVLLENERFFNAHTAVLKARSWYLVQKVKSIAIVNNGRDLEIRIEAGRR